MLERSCGMYLVRGKQSQGLRKKRVSARSAMQETWTAMHLYLIGEQQRSEDHTNGSPGWLDEIGGETLGTRSRGSGSRATGGRRSRDSTSAESCDEQSCSRARIQVRELIWILDKR